MKAPRTEVHGGSGGGVSLFEEGGETQGTLEQGAGGVIHFSGLLQDRVSHCGASRGSEETREAEATVPGLQKEAALEWGDRVKSIVGGSAGKAMPSMTEASAKGQAALAVLTDMGRPQPNKL